MRKPVKTRKLNIFDKCLVFVNTDRRWQGGAQLLSSCATKRNIRGGRVRGRKPLYTARHTRIVNHDRNAPARMCMTFSAHAQATTNARSCQSMLMPLAGLLRMRSKGMKIT